MVGVGLEIKTLATVSDGRGEFREEHQSPYAPKEVTKKRRRLAKSLSSRNKVLSLGKSHRRISSRPPGRLARIDARTANIRADATHKATTDLCRTCAEIVLEDMSVQGMMANHKIAGTMNDAAFFEFRRQIDYKAKSYACKVTIAPWFFPSSKLCREDVWTKQPKSHIEGSRLDVPRMSRRAPARSECGSKFSRSHREFTGDSLDCGIQKNCGSLAMRTWQWSGQLWLRAQTRTGNWPL